MAKKKVTRKKTRATSARSAATRSSARKKPAKPSKKKKTVKKVAKKQTTARASTKETTKKKVAVKPVAKKVATTTKKAPTAKTGARTKKKTPARKSISKAEAARIAAVTPDANGYVIINGRRIRMMSAIVEVVTPKKSRSSAKNPSAPLAAVTDKPVKTKLKKKDLDHYRDMLLDRRRELVGDLNSMEKQALHSGGGGLSHMPIHMADVGTDTFDQDFMLGLAEGERRRLREIDGALQRIRDRTYGICETTRKPIPKARLNAKPWARYTIEAARQVERGIGE